MSNDEREEERQFLAGLKARTGRDLAAWMAEIAQRGFGDKNEIIDWLRGEGLPFARASWLERIHRNGGKPIYADAPSAPPAPVPATEDTQSEVPPVKAEPPRRPKPAPEAKQAGETAKTVARDAAKAPAKEKPAAQPADAAAELEKLIAAAKGYRPLYQLLEAQIRQAIPGIVVTPHSRRYISLGAPGELAAVTLHPTEIRLGLDLGDRPFDALAQQAKLRGPGPAITHMVVLTDARQVNDALLALVRIAHQRVNGAGQ